MYSFSDCYIDIICISEYELSFKNAHTPSYIKAPLLLRITVRHTNTKATVCSKTTCFAKFRGTLRKNRGFIFSNGGSIFPNGGSIFSNGAAIFSKRATVWLNFPRIQSCSGTRKLYGSCAFSSSFSVYENGAVRNVNLSHVGFYKMFVETFSGAEGAACFC